MVGPCLFFHFLSIKFHQRIFPFWESYFVIFLKMAEKTFFLFSSSFYFPIFRWSIQTHTNYSHVYWISLTASFNIRQLTFFLFTLFFFFPSLFWQLLSRFFASNIFSFLFLSLWIRLFFFFFCYLFFFSLLFFSSSCPCALENGNTHTWKI